MEVLRVSRCVWRRLKELTSACRGGRGRCSARRRRQLLLRRTTAAAGAPATTTTATQQLAAINCQLPTDLFRDCVGRTKHLGRHPRQVARQAGRLLKRSPCTRVWEVRLLGSQHEAACAMQLCNTIRTVGGPPVRTGLGRVGVLGSRGVAWAGLQLVKKGGGVGQMAGRHANRPGWQGAAALCVGWCKGALPAG